MLISLVESLLRKKMAQQAAGIWIRHNLGVSTHANEKLKEQVEAIPYQQKFDRQPVDAFGPIKT